MPATKIPAPRPTSRSSLLARLFDAAAMASYPLVARALGYRFCVGTDPTLVAHGAASPDSTGLTSP